MEKDYLKRILNFPKDIETAIAYIKENYGVNCELNEEDNKLHLWTSNINESLQLVAAKNYIINNIGEDLVGIVYGR